MRHSILNDFPNIIDVLKESFSGKDGNAMSKPAGVIYPTDQDLVFISGDEICIENKIYRNIDPETMGTDVIRSRLSVFYDYLCHAKPYVITHSDGRITTVDRLSESIKFLMKGHIEYSPATRLGRDLRLYAVASMVVW